MLSESTIYVIRWKRISLLQIMLKYLNMAQFYYQLYLDQISGWRFKGAFCCGHLFFYHAKTFQSVPAAYRAMYERVSTVVRRTCMWPWRSPLAEHYPACPRQCVSAWAVCSWQTYCTSVKMQAATWSTVNSMYPSSAVYHSSSPTIAQSPTGINKACLYLCYFSGKNFPVMEQMRFWIAAMYSHSDHYLHTWRLKRHWTLATDGISAIVHLVSSNSHLHTVNGPWCICCTAVYVYPVLTKASDRDKRHKSFPFSWVTFMAFAPVDMQNTWGH